MKKLRHGGEKIVGAKTDTWEVGLPPNWSVHLIGGPQFSKTFLPTKSIQGFHCILKHITNKSEESSGILLIL